MITLRLVADLAFACDSASAASEARADIDAATLAGIAAERPAEPEGFETLCGGYQ